MMKGSENMRTLQRLLGLILIVCGIVSVMLTGDGTVALMLVPWGIWLVFSKDMLLSVPTAQKHIKMHPQSRGKRKGA